VLVFARDGGVASRALQWRPLVLLGQLSFALYMVHLFFVIVPNRLLPPMFAASGHAEWIRPGRHTFGLESIDPPALVANLLTVGLVALALGAAWLAWRYIEEPARHWTRRFAPPSGGAPVPGI
jgi:peptidoglycan/LPS O-acetylase OafA/YrhL